METKEIVDLGWHNAGGETAKLIDQYREMCREQKHEPVDVDLTWPRGIDHRVTCANCGYEYHYDSSD